MITNDNDKATESFPQELLIWANNHIANDFIHSNLQHVYSRQSLWNNLEFLGHKGWQIMAYSLWDSNPRLLSGPKF